MTSGRVTVLHVSADAPVNPASVYRSFLLLMPDDHRKRGWLSIQPRDELFMVICFRDCEDAKRVLGACSDKMVSGARLKLTVPANGDDDGLRFAGMLYDLPDFISEEDVASLEALVSPWSGIEKIELNNKSKPCVLTIKCFLASAGHVDAEIRTALKYLKEKKLQQINATGGHAEAQTNAGMGIFKQEWDIRTADRTELHSHSEVNIAVSSNQTAAVGEAKVPEEEPLPEFEDCPICADSMIGSAAKLVCGHVICSSCIVQLKNNNIYKCPFCQRVVSTPRGNQPNGSMHVDKSGWKLPGHENSKGTYTITYNFLSGVQNETHMNPGHFYEGTTRTAYLPISPDGDRVLSMLRKAFNARLVFTIGRSATTGRDNSIVWNIHHKTSQNGPYGYPDPTYFQRVTQELAAVGIIDESA